MRGFDSVVEITCLCMQVIMASYIEDVIVLASELSDHFTLQAILSAIAKVDIQQLSRVIHSNST